MENYIVNRSFLTLSVIDYVVIGLSLSLAVAIGIFFAWKDRNQSKNVDNFLMASRSLPPIPIALSLTTSFISAITVLGTPVEFYRYGTMFTWFILCYLISCLFACVIVAKIYDKKISSSFDFLGQRYDSQLIRNLTLVTNYVQTLLYSGVAMYSPAIAVQEAAGLDYWLAILITGVICIFYTTIGGLKAVVWTDSLQLIFLVCGFVALVAQSWVDFGSFSDIWEVSKNGSRIEFLDMDIDPRTRHSIWSIVIGGTFGVWGWTYCASQAQIQRYVSCNSKKNSQTALMINWVLLAIITVLCGMCGLGMYAYFAGCDPASAGWVGAVDQLIPYWSLVILEDSPGLTGLYIAGAFAGTLSTLSTSINALATVTLEDVVKTFVEKKKMYSVEVYYPYIAKGLVVFFGAAIVAISFVVQYLGSIVQAALSMGLIQKS